MTSHGHLLSKRELYFALYDVDGNGLISKEELATILAEGQLAFQESAWGVVGVLRRVGSEAAWASPISSPSNAAVGSPAAEAGGAGDAGAAGETGEAGEVKQPTEDAVVKKKSLKEVNIAAFQQILVEELCVSHCFSRILGCQPTSEIKPELIAQYRANSMPSRLRQK